MAEVSVEHLRTLRDRVKELLRKTEGDLKPFLNADKLTFRRKPDSKGALNDINVTTTCSCLMALALTKRLSVIYGQKTNPDGKQSAKKAFWSVVDASWMSSGLTENNAFTTTLVLRTFGFLREEEILDLKDGMTPVKHWEPNLGIRDLPALATAIKARQLPWSDFVWRSLSDETRRKLEEWTPASPLEETDKKLKTVLILELGRLVQKAIYETNRFPEATDPVIKAITDAETTYKLATANHSLFVEAFPAGFSPLSKRSLADIATSMAAQHSHFRINYYAESAAVVYWFVDAVTRAQFVLTSTTWSDLCRWAAERFNHERSLVAAGHAVRMDPVAMAMWACLCSRLVFISSSAADTPMGRLGATRDNLAVLPSRTELEHAIRDLWKYQTDGVWPKYFPLFDYQDAGSNFCFTFELLEAVLVEFGRPDNEILDDEFIIKGLDNAITWCEANKLKWPHKTLEYRGWNSGGNLETLRRGQPESWATAVVHMFLWELDEALSARIQSRLLKKYRARTLAPGAPGVANLLDIEIAGKWKLTGLKEILTAEIVVKHKNEDAHKLFGRSMKSERSALLFGPPGTSKTKVTEAVARDLGWQIIQIDPSHFLRNGLEQIYIEANSIFRDLMDLAGVVVLFDEMDALVQTRDGAAKLDTAAQFLTTFMLPKLTELHDHGKVIFFMATNFQERFDPAIKRAGRFDLLLCMGPPTLKEKLNALEMFVEEKPVEGGEEIQKAAKLIQKYCNAKPRTGLQLELYTFGEFRSFVKSLGRSGNDIIAKLKSMDAAQFANRVATDSADVGLRLNDLKPIEEAAKKQLKKGPPAKLAGYDTLDLNRKELESTMNATTRYIFDRRESKQQD